MTVFIDADSIVFTLAMTQNTRHDLRRVWKRRIQDIMNACWEDEALVCIKGTSKNFRHQLLSSYKANRGPLPPNILEKITYLYEHAAEEGAIRATDNWEADDQVADWVLEAYHSDMDYTIAHIDKDLDMLPGKHYNYKKDEHYELSVSDCYRDFFAQLFIGDTADNLPGVKGIGKVKANRLLDQHSAQSWYHLIRDHWNSDIPLDVAARCYFMGDPEKFTWDLRKLYGKEETKADLEVVHELQSDKSTVLCWDDLESWEGTDQVLRVEQDSPGMDGSSEDDSEGI